MEYFLYKAYYKNSKSKFASFIRLKQRLQGLKWPFSEYSHEEIVFAYSDDLEVLRIVRKIREIYGDSNMNTPVLQRDDYFKARSLWFSSSESDGWCRFKFIRDNKDNWDFFKVEVSREEYIEALKFCTKFDDYEYGWTKIIFLQVFKTFWFIKQKTFFCSEICVIISQVFAWMYKWENSILMNPWQSAEYADKFEQNKWVWVQNIS